MSGDSDLSPVTDAVKQLCPAKKVGIIIPQNQYAVNLKQNSDFHKKLETKHLRKSLLSAQITYQGQTITAPTDGFLCRLFNCSARCLFNIR
jgi:hypothetical protein